MKDEEYVIYDVCISKYICMYVYGILEEYPFYGFNNFFLLLFIILYNIMTKQKKTKQNINIYFIFFLNFTFNQNSRYC